MEAADRAKANPRQWQAVLDAVATLEAGRQARELDEADRAVLDAASIGHGHLVGNRFGYFPLHMGWWARAGADGRKERVDPPRRVLWRAFGRELAVVDQPAIPAAQVHAVAEKGVLRPYDLQAARWSPYRDYFVHLGDYTYNAEWRAVRAFESGRGLATGARW